MSEHHILLIHGTWCNGTSWGDFATQVERRGFTVHAPTLRHHGPPNEADVWGNAQKVTNVGLLDYVADLAELVDSMDSPPIIVGHSVGALLAQLLAARRPNKGVILLGAAPAPGMFAFYPSMVRLWMRYLPQWLSRTPMYPVSWNPWTELICNAQPPELQESYYATLCAESGTAYFEMALWFLDRKRAARVDYDAIRSPVLSITGSQDKCTVPRIGRVTAQKYGQSGAYVELEGSDHMMIGGPYLSKTLAAVDEWLTNTGLHPSRAAASLKTARRG
jgi:pimeloyl-ACP methyl ester carboxylesterase